MAAQPTSRPTGDRRADDPDGRPVPGAAAVHAGSTRLAAVRRVPGAGVSPAAARVAGGPARQRRLTTPRNCTSGPHQRVFYCLEKRMIEQLTRQLRRDEGVRAHMYYDSEGYATIGVGRLIDPRR